MSVFILCFCANFKICILKLRLLCSFKFVLSLILFEPDQADPIIHHFPFSSTVMKAYINKLCFSIKVINTIYHVINPPVIH